MLTLGSNMVISAGSNLTAATGNVSINPIVQSSPKAIMSWGNFDITLSRGSAINFNAGSSYTLLPRTDLPVVGGMLVLNNSGGILNVSSGSITNLGSAGVGSNLVLTAVPEPSTYAMMFFGFLGLASVRRKTI